MSLDQKILILITKVTAARHGFNFGNKQKKQLNTLYLYSTEVNRKDTNN